MRSLVQELNTGSSGNLYKVARNKFSCRSLGEGKGCKKKDND